MDGISNLIAKIDRTLTRVVLKLVLAVFGRLPSIDRTLTRVVLKRYI